MKKKILFITLSFLILLPCVLMLSACDASFFDKSLWKVEREATCTEKGLKSRIIDGQREEREIPSLGHKYGNWTRVKEPTCTIEGEKQRTCERCNYVDSEDIAPYHLYDTANILDYDEDNHWFRCKRCTDKTRLFEHKFEYKRVPIIIYGFSFCEVVGYEDITTCEDCDIKIRDTHLITEKTQEQYSEDSVRPFELFNNINRFNSETPFELNYNFVSDKKLTSYTVREVGTSANPMLSMEAIIDGQSYTINNIYKGDWELNFVHYYGPNNEDFYSNSVEYSVEGSYTRVKINYPIGCVQYEYIRDDLDLYIFNDENDPLKYYSNFQDRYTWLEVLYNYNYKTIYNIRNFEFLNEDNQKQIVSADLEKRGDKIGSYAIDYDNRKNLTKIVRKDAEGNLKSQLDLTYNEENKVETMKYKYYDGETLVTDKTWTFESTDNSYGTTDGSYMIKFKDTHSNNNTNLN